jgi:hypothetical protein
MIEVYEQHGNYPLTKGNIMATVDATLIEETLVQTGYRLLEKLEYAVEYVRVQPTNEKRVYIDFGENSIAIDVYNAADRLISTEKIVVKHVTDLNRAAQHIV